MKELTITTMIKECGFEELPGADRELVEAARQMTRTSYAPYSRFHVGAAIRLDDGTIVCGSNQENAASPSGICAERTACFQAGALYPGRRFSKIAIAAWTSLHKPEGMPYDDYFQESPISPCGACRQALLEYETRGGEPVEVILYGRRRCYIFPSVASLLPYCFTEF
ncbi:MAG: cytidine deaminase [Muribaculaceae bacterium]|nr:cytidine deaminase [Muribaculaceae bacterium]